MNGLQLARMFQTNEAMTLHINVIDFLSQQIQVTMTSFQGLSTSFSSSFFVFGWLEEMIKWNFLSVSFVDESYFATG